MTTIFILKKKIKMMKGMSCEKRIFSLSETNTFTRISFNPGYHYSGFKLFIRAPSAWFFVHLIG